MRKHNTSNVTLYCLESRARKQDNDTEQSTYAINKIHLNRLCAADMSCKQIAKIKIRYIYNIYVGIILCSFCLISCSIVVFNAVQ